MQELSGKHKVVVAEEEADKAAAVEAEADTANKAENNSPSNVSNGWG